MIANDDADAVADTTLYDAAATLISTLGGDDVKVQVLSALMLIEGLNENGETGMYMVATSQSSTVVRLGLLTWGKARILEDSLELDEF